MLDNLDLSVSLDEETYSAESEREQTRLKRLVRQVEKQQRPLIVVVEGWEAPARVPVIRYITGQIAPHLLAVHGISAFPSDVSRHYLAYFWEHLPERGHIAFFDGSWYTHPLIDTIKGDVPPEDRERAYRDINMFERQLVDFGVVVCKFWIHSGKDGQSWPQEEPDQALGESWSITRQSWFDAARWGDYVSVADDLLLKTSTLNAPWVIVEGNDEYWAQVKTLKKLNGVLSRELMKPSHSPSEPGKKKKSKKKKSKKKKSKKKKKKKK